MSIAIHKKIVLDKNNKPSEVIISYDEWEKIEELLANQQKNMQKKNLSKYSGILHLEEDPLNFQRRIRSEWQ